MDLQQLRASRLGDPLPQRVAVFRALQLGDLLCSVPALRALRNALPESRITLIGLPWARGFVERFSHLLDDFVEFVGHPALPEQSCDLSQMPGFLRQVQERRFDLCLQLHGSGTVVNPLVMLFGARRTAGFFAPGQYCPDPDRFIAYPESEHEIRRPLRLLESLGIERCGEQLEFPLQDGDFAELTELSAAQGIAPGRYVCLHPGSRAPSRRWPAERFAQVGDALARDGWTVVLTGSASERELVGGVLGAMRMPAVNLAGRTTLGGLAALVAGARLLISNDTGVVHIASGVGTPSVVLFTAADWRRWAPLDRTRVSVLRHPVDCQPCSYLECPIGHPCALGITVEAVLFESRRLLEACADMHLAPQSLRTWQEARTCVDCAS